MTAISFLTSAFATSCTKSPPAPKTYTEDEFILAGFWAPYEITEEGFEKYKIVLSKLLVMILIWTLGYLLYFILTYVYTIYYWDNSIVSNLPFSVIIWWVFGIFIIALFMMFSVNFETSGSALALTGGVVFLLYLISLLPKINQYLPITLSDGNSLIYGLKQVGFYLPSLIITILLIGSLVMGSILLFNKKSL